MKALIFLVLIYSRTSFGINCDCDIRIYSPVGSSLKIEPIILKTLEVESFSSYSTKNQIQCRKSCQEEFHSVMPTERMKAFLEAYSQELISQGRIGYNCTGLTVLKYPVKVRARLANLGLGNVSDQIETVAHEENCFN